MAKEKIVASSGTRKRAVERATLKPGTGIVRINSKALDTYKPHIAQLKIKEALILAEGLGTTVNISVKVHGGGVMGQAEAARMAIARGLILFSKDKKLKETYENYDRQLIVADVRQKETRKPNYSKARKARQKSYR